MESQEVLRRVRAVYYSEMESFGDVDVKLCECGDDPALDRCGPTSQD